MPLPSSQVDLYPVWLEDWWKQEACRLLGERKFEDTQATLEKATQRLSDLFTTGRQARFGDYGRDEQLLLAYGLFYFPQTFTRIRFPLLEALHLHQWRPAAPGAPVRVLDLGAGLGGATIGTALLLQETPAVTGVEALAVDQSSESLRLLQRLAGENQAHLPRVQFKTARGDLKTWFRQAPPEDHWDLIIASFSLGEAFFDANDDQVHHWIKTAFQRLRPGGLLLITEPALRETSERIERLRNLIAADKSGRIWAPCPHHQRCPLLETGTYWCHEVRSWTVPESLAFLNRRLFRAVGDLKFSFLLAGPPPAPEPNPDAGSPALMRLVSPLGEMKGRYVWAGCAADGLRYEFEIQKRDLNREDQDKLRKLERGDVLEVSACKPLGDRLRRRVNSLADLQRWSPKQTGEESGGPSGTP